MDELDRILINKFSPLKNMDLPNEDQEWKKLQKKVRWQNFKTFRLGNMNMYYAAIFLVFASVCSTFVYSNFNSDNEKDYKNEIIENRKEIENSEKEVIARMTQKVVRNTHEKLENKKAKFDSSKEKSKTALPVSEKIASDSVQPVILEKEIVQQTFPKSKFVFKTDTIVKTDTLKVKNIKRYQKNNQTQPRDSSFFYFFYLSVS